MSGFSSAVPFSNASRSVQTSLVSTGKSDFRQFRLERSVVGTSSDKSDAATPLGATLTGATGAAGASGVTGVTGGTGASSFGGGNSSRGADGSGTAAA